MPVSVTDLAKKLEIAEEAVVLHAMDLDFDIPDDDLIPDDIAKQIEELEVGNTLSQVEHEYEDIAEREVIEQQAAQTVGNRKKIQKKKDEQRKREKDKPEEAVVQQATTRDGRVILPDMLSVREFAQKISRPLPLVLIKLKQNGIIANIKQDIDYETMAVVADEFSVAVTRQSAELSGEDLFRGDLTALLADEEPENLRPRPPVICIMGHVDHGKTSLLDSIRKTNVAEGEAGGITQRIGAYQVEVEGRKVTFLDTPGHEAFTAMRARGAKVTDIAVLVVAATEGLKPQSLEAIHHIHDAEVPLLVAINKMDMPGANADMVKGQLAENGVNPDDWGGDVPCVPLSAKTGQGIPSLLEQILLVADMQEIQANPARRAIATVIESTQDKRTGITATVLVNTGTLHLGDDFVIHDQSGRIRKMTDYTGAELKTAPPSTAVQIAGLSQIPSVGDLLQVMQDVKHARKKAEEVASLRHEDTLAKQRNFSLAQLRQRLLEGQMQTLKLIVKAESHGTLEAVVSELEKIKTEKAMVKVVHKGIGDFTESDVMLASAGQALLIGFSVELPGRIKKTAEQQGVSVFTSEVIYQLQEHIQDILEGREKEEVGEEILGQFVIKAVFASNKRMAVLGGEVTVGVLKAKAQLRILRKAEDGETSEREDGLMAYGRADVGSVQLGQKVVSEANAGVECGMKVAHKNLEFAPGMTLEIYREPR
ncbi:translation initiation factor IF-2 [Candidatus Peribacteria bacterium]|nr:translation initiation factor IF-2 [Candidatus Peribacteria bacterium]